MGQSKRLFEIFERVTGFDPNQDQTETPSSKWNVNEIESLLMDMGQDSHKFTGNGNGFSNGDFGRVKFQISDNTLYLEFQTPEIAHMAINKLSDSLSNPYEFSSRFDQMPNTVMVQFTDSGIAEGDLEYAHATDAGPNSDQYKIGEGEDTSLGTDEKGSPIYVSGFEDIKALSPNDQAKVIAVLKNLKAQNKISPIGEDMLNIWYKYHPEDQAI